MREACGYFRHYNMTHWGATTEEWAAWRTLAAEDLVPVVSNPNAEISPRSDMKQKGKVPSVYNREGRVAGIPKWPLNRADADDIAHWSREGDYGICLITRRWRALDIDSEDAALVAQIEAHILAELDDLAMLGDAERTEHGCPTRARADSARRLLLVETEGDLAKMVIRLSEAKEQIEALASGQQCIVAGTHTGGQRYEWLGGPPTAERIPRLTVKGWETLLRGLSARFGTSVSTVRSSLKPVARSAIAPVDAAKDPVGHYLLEHRSDIVVGREAGKIHIVCPWSAEHSDPEIAGSGTSWLVGGEAKGPDGSDEPPRFRCLHAHCADRGEGLFKLAIGALPFENLTLQDTPPPEARSWAEVALDIKSRMLKMSTKEVGQNDVASCLTNVALMVATPEGTQLIDREFAWDTTISAYVVRPWQPLEPDGSWSPLPIARWRPIAERDQAHVRRVWDVLTKPGGSSAAQGVVPGLWSERQLTKPITKEMVHDALHVLTDPERADSGIPMRSFDSAQCMLHQLRWDGVPRMEEFWIRYAGVPDTPYARAVGRYTWTGLAARVLQPGCQADMAVLLLGLQGARKTSFFQAMCLHESWYSSINLEAKEDDLIRMQRGKIIVEMEELRGLAGRDQQWTKAFLTRRIDEWVPKFEEHRRAYARRHLYFGSGNEFHVLDDPTGERRYLPLRSGLTDTDALLLPTICRDPVTGERFTATLRELLWAEGMAAFQESGIAWQEAERLARPEHARYKKINDHPWREVFGAWIKAQLREPWSESHPLETGMTSHEFLHNVVPNFRHRDNAGDVKTVEKVMLVMGWTRTFAPGRVLGEPEREVWIPPLGIFAGRRPVRPASGYPNGHPEIDTVVSRADPGGGEDSVSAK